MGRAQNIFEVAVIGGGHAGVEAALAAARLGAETVLVSHDPRRIGALSCNPAVGGLGKGHLVKEIDALGGLIGLAADGAGIQFRCLNTRKGPAVRATRVQVDRAVYGRLARRFLLRQPRLRVVAGEAAGLWLEKGFLRGLILADGARLAARSVVAAAGTFLGGLIHVGRISFPAGRMGDPPSIPLSQTLAGLGLTMGRLKTGTPPRLLRRSIDFQRLKVQPGDPRPGMLSILSPGPRLPQRPCHVTWTTARTREIAAAALDRSALYGGRIQGTGARYCPSFEDKVVKFPDKDSHHVFIEPEGLDSEEIYPNGISNSLPLDVQAELVKSLPGLEAAVMVRPGYAIEYDFVQPTELGQELMVKKLPGLFLAGQINGTSGYEEAAAQGLMAGLNAVRWIRDLEPVVLTRDRAYTGVMIDDLTTLGCDEPYRMFTSRAEYRLLLREENAAERLTPLGRELGLVGEDQWARFSRRQEARERAGQEIRARRIRPDRTFNQGLSRLGSATLSGPVRLTDLLKRPELSWPALVELIPELGELDRASAQAVEVELKYAGYVARQQAQVERFKELESRRLPKGMDYGRLPGLTKEVVEKLTLIQPRSLGQAARIPGVTPAAVMVLAVRTRSNGRSKAPDSPESNDNTGRASSPARAETPGGNLEADLNRP